jgi:hypothetical protein
MTLMTRQMSLRWFPRGLDYVLLIRGNEHCLPSFARTSTALFMSCYCACKKHQLLLQKLLRKCICNPKMPAIRSRESTCFGIAFGGHVPHDSRQFVFIQLGFVTHSLLPAHLGHRSCIAHHSPISSHPQDACR